MPKLRITTEIEFENIYALEHHVKENLQGLSFDEKLLLLSQKQVDQGEFDEDGATAKIEIVEDE